MIGQNNIFFLFYLHNLLRLQNRWLLSLLLD